jgi:hypothetical protein
MLCSHERRYAGACQQRIKWKADRPRMSWRFSEVSWTGGISLEDQALLDRGLGFVFAGSARDKLLTRLRQLDDIPR